MRDGDLQDLAVKAYNLKTLNISWCNGVSDIGVRAVIDNCLLLERLVLTGLKDLSDAAFTEYAMLKPYFLEGSTLGSQTIADQFLNATPALLFGRKTLRNLSLLECSSCNNVSDSLLRLLACLLTKAVVLNYYGAHMEFAKTYVFP